MQKEKNNLKENLIELLPIDSNKNIVIEIP